MLHALLLPYTTISTQQRASRLRLGLHGPLEPEVLGRLRRGDDAPLSPQSLQVILGKREGEAMGRVTMAAT